MFHTSSLILHVKCLNLFCLLSFVFCLLPYAYVLCLMPYVFQFSALCYLSYVYKNCCINCFINISIVLHRNISFR
ncbi:hypothetical protein GC098_17395 [Paenibacillus sp. LMG 31458]|uniref:Uncharacterized protein n=1 Tax=Paenibacillus phytorum TaxID=2654977 RepID=A0ABX1XZQ8_9BACL|nr:hypothetical protein [Paenibacillus phytorum]